MITKYILLALLCMSHAHACEPYCDDSRVRQYKEFAEVDLEASRALALTHDLQSTYRSKAIVDHSRYEQAVKSIHRFYTRGLGLTDQEFCSVNLPRIFPPSTNDYGSCFDCLVNDIKSTVSTRQLEGKIFKRQL